MTKQGGVSVSVCGPLTKSTSSDPGGNDLAEYFCTCRASGMPHHDMFIFAMILVLLQLPGPSGLNLDSIICGRTLSMVTSLSFVIRRNVNLRPPSPFSVLSAA